MKHVLVIVLALGLTLSAKAQSFHGKKISEDGAIPATELATKIGDQKEVKTKVEGTVQEVCKMKGCWMTVKTAEGKTMRVTFKDYGFFVPKDIAGKQVVFEGLAQTTVTPVSELRNNRLIIVISPVEVNTSTGLFLLIPKLYATAVNVGEFALNIQLFCLHLPINDYLYSRRDYNPIQCGWFSSTSPCTAIAPVPFPYACYQIGVAHCLR
jgi:hypothetical protein